MIIYLLMIFNDDDSYFYLIYISINVMLFSLYYTELNLNINNVLRR